MFGIATLRASTEALKTAWPAVTLYNSLEQQIARLAAEPDTLASQINQGLDGLAFERQPIGSDRAQDWADRANALMAQAAYLGIAE